MTDVVHVASGDLVSVSRVMGWATTVDVATVVHPVIGSGIPDFTIAAPGPRTGTYRFLMLDEVSATTLAALLERPGAFAVTGADAAMALASFYVTGSIRYTLDDDTLVRVVVEADWTETS